MKNTHVQTLTDLDSEKICANRESKAYPLCAATQGTLWNAKSSIPILEEAL